MGDGCSSDVCIHFSLSWPQRFCWYSFPCVGLWHVGKRRQNQPRHPGAQRQLCGNGQGSDGTQLLLLSAFTFWQKPESWFLPISWLFAGSSGGYRWVRSFWCTWRAQVSHPRVAWWSGTLPGTISFVSSRSSLPLLSRCEERLIITHRNSLNNCNTLCLLQKECNKILLYASMLWLAKVHNITVSFAW